LSPLPVHTTSNFKSFQCHLHQTNTKILDYSIQIPVLRYTVQKVDYILILKETCHPLQPQLISLILSWKGSTVQG
jgi:hypothetical protein